MVDGWTRPTDMTPLSFARRFDRLDLGGIIVTDIDYDIDLPEASFALVTEMARHLTTPVIVSGTATDARRPGGPGVRRRADRGRP